MQKNWRKNLLMNNAPTVKEIQLDLLQNFIQFARTMI